jgi:hypothetical protein
MAIDVMESNKTIEMFQAMAIVNLNLGSKVQSLKIKLTTIEGEKQGLFRQMRKSRKAMTNIRSKRVVGRKENGNGEK